MPKGVTSSKECVVCQRYISLFAYNKHVASHDKQKLKPVKRTVCRFCHEVFVGFNSLGQHENKCRSNPNRYIQPVSEETRRKISEANKNQIWTEEKRKKQSDSMRKAVAKHPDSYSKNNVCGRVKIVEYHGHKLKGQWELKTAQWLDAQQVVWDTESYSCVYDWNGSIRTYYPDFHVKDYNVYIEVKGYKTDRDLAKWEQFDQKLVVIDASVIDKLSEMSIIDLIENYSYGTVV